MSHVPYSICRVGVPADAPVHVVLLHQRRTTYRKPGCGQYSKTVRNYRFPRCLCRKEPSFRHGSRGLSVSVGIGRRFSEVASAQALAAFETAFASLLADATTAEGGETGREAVAAALALLLMLLRGRLLVLHGGRGPVMLALGGTVLALGRAVLALRRAVLALRGAVGGLRVLGITSSLVLVVFLVGHG